MELSSNDVGDSNDENSILPKLLLTNTQISKFCKSFGNGFSSNIKLLNIQLHKIGQSVGFLRRLLWPLLKTEFPLLKNVLKPSDEITLIPAGLTAALELTVAGPSTDSVIHKKMFESGSMTLIISNEEMNDITKIVKSLEKSGILIKYVREAIFNEAKKQKEGFLEMLLGTLGAGLLGVLLTGKDTIRASEGKIKAGEGTIRAPSLPNFKIQKYYQNKPKFNGVYSRNNLLKIKDGVYVINCDEYNSIGSHWIALYVYGNNIMYFDSFGF